MRKQSWAVSLVVVFAFVSGAYAAPIEVNFETGFTLQAAVDVDGGVTKLHISDDSTVNNSVLSAKLMQGGTQIGDIIEIADDADFDISLDLVMTQNGANDWSAAGTLALTDVDMGTNAIVAAFDSYSVGFFSGTLNIVGALSGNPILVNRESAGAGTWTFEGDGSETISIANAHDYTGGTLFQFQFSTGKNTLDELLTADGFHMEGGQLKGTVVPAPSALVLAGLGMALTSRMRRRMKAA